MTEPDTVKKLAALALAAFLLAGLAACGKKGPPTPRQATRSFVWQEVNITPNVSGKCLEVNALMSGVYRNMESLVLELAAVNGEEDCPGCPFLATERHEIKSLTNVFDPNKGTVVFGYCPREEALSYRARLIGVNVFDSTRHEISPEQLVVMPLRLK